MTSDLFYHPPTSRTHGRARSSSTSSDDMDDYTYDSSSSSSSSSSSLAAKRFPNPLPTAPLRITRRGSTSSVASNASTATSSPQVSPNRASFRPLPKVPEKHDAEAAPSPPPPRASELAPDTPQSARLRRLPVPPIRSPGGDDALLLAARRRSAQRPAGGLKRSNTRTADFAMNDVIDWDQLGDILCDIEED